MIRIAYRHDAHKLTGQSHANADDTFAGVPVNQPVPYGTDADAAQLSRPSGTPEPTIPQQTTPARLSLLTGKPVGDLEAWTESAIRRSVRELLTESDPEEMHTAWLTSDVAALFNESVYYPYTSLKYHTLLVAALVANYRTTPRSPNCSLLWTLLRRSSRIGQCTPETDAHLALTLMVWQAGSIPRFAVFAIVGSGLVAASRAST